MESAKSKSKGDVGEALAETYLSNKGFRILQRKYYYDHGEIDLVAEDGAVLVFVEVKTRYSNHGASPEESITPEKEHYLKRTAEGYVAEKKIGKKECRFDLVAVEWEDKRPVIRHLKDIFS